MALNPDLSIGKAKNQLMSQIFDDRAFVEIWANCSSLEKLILSSLSKKEIHGLFSTECRTAFSQAMGIADITISSIQSALRVLQRKGIIGRLVEKRVYFIDDSNFKNWLLSHQE
jgi:hypothetical protein